MSIFLLDLAVAWILDMLLGDPTWLPHPVRWLGNWINLFEKVLRKRVNATCPTSGQKRNRAEFQAGIVLLLTTFFLAFGGAAALVGLGFWLHPLLGHMVNTWLLYQALATRCLMAEGLKVARTLETGTLPEARLQVSMLVGRETAGLDEAGVVRATVETLAENAVDGVLSPLFYALIGCLFGLAAPLAWGFKAVSTLDSMVGYKNDKYLYLGRASARTDDALNFLPARIAGPLTALAALCTGLDAAGGWRIFLRDRKNHSSPNSAHGESAFAGALGVQLGGPATYHGKRVEKPTLGDPLHATVSGDIRTAARLLGVLSFLALCLALGLGGVVFCLT